MKFHGHRIFPSLFRSAVKVLFAEFFESCLRILRASVGALAGDIQAFARGRRILVAAAMSSGGQMKPLAVYGQEVAVEDLVLHSAMEVDMDGDSMDRLTDGAQLLDHKPTDADFFDNFEDDFDDADLV